MWSSVLAGSIISTSQLCVGIVRSQTWLDTTSLEVEENFLLKRRLPAVKDKDKSTLISFIIMAMLDYIQYRLQLLPVPCRLTAALTLGFPWSQGPQSPQSSSLFSLQVQISIFLSRYTCNDHYFHLVVSSTPLFSVLLKMYTHVITGSFCCCFCPASLHLHWSAAFGLCLHP